MRSEALQVRQRTSVSSLSHPYSPLLTHIHPTSIPLQFALRWRTEDEVLSGSGETTCGNTRCPLHFNIKATPNTQLTTLELPFTYQEHGAAKSALVKVVLCAKCVRKLMWKRTKEKGKEEAAEADKREDKEEDKGKGEEEGTNSVRVKLEEGEDDSFDQRRRKKRSRNEAGAEEEEDEGEKSSRRRRKKSSRSKSPRPSRRT